MGLYILGCGRGCKALFSEESATALASGKMDIWVVDHH